MEINPRWANYFDNAATTPLDPRVLEAMLPYLGDEFGNAHSIHQWGSRTMAAVEKAREQIARAIGWDDPQAIFFCSGATEANNWVLRSSEPGIISPFEHSSVREPAIELGYDICPNDGYELNPGGGTELGMYPIQSLMLVNNEIGTRFGPDRYIEGEIEHSDITQALGKCERFLSESSNKVMTASSHKAYGPKGVGMVVWNAGWISGQARPLAPFILGGEQEGGFRAGTLNVPGIVGFGAACALIDESREVDWTLASECRNAIKIELDATPDWRINGEPENPWEMLDFVPHILSISFLGIEGETLVIEADNAGFAISAGAACSSRSTEPSHVLTALGLEPEWIRGTVRISFGRFNTVEAAAKLGKTLANAVERLRSMRS